MSFIFQRAGSISYDQKTDDILPSDAHPIFQTFAELFLKN